MAAASPGRPDRRDPRRPWTDMAIAWRVGPGRGLPRGLLRRVRGALRWRDGDRQAGRPLDDAHPLRRRHVLRLPAIHSGNDPRSHRRTCEAAARGRSRPRRAHQRRQPIPHSPGPAGDSPGRPAPSPVMSRPLAVVDAVDEEPQPEHLDVVLGEVAGHIATYIECSAHAQTALSLWVVYSHLIPPKGAPPHDVVPYLFITSVERQSGKTTLLDVLRPIAARPVMLAGTSPAALLRMLSNRPTLFLDEVDTIFRASAADATQEMLRGILNSGYRSTGKFARFELKQREYPTFGPKALAGIGRDIPESVYDRCIVVRLERREASGPRRVKRARLRRLDSEGSALAERIVRAIAGLDLRPLADDDFPN